MRSAEFFIQKVVSVPRSKTKARSLSISALMFVAERPFRISIAISCSSESTSALIHIKHLRISLVVLPFPTPTSRASELWTSRCPYTPAIGTLCCRNSFCYAGFLDLEDRPVRSLLDQERQHKTRPTKLKFIYIFCGLLSDWYVWRE